MTFLVLVISISIVIFFLPKSQTNPVTHKKQYISSTVREEIAVALQCAPDLAARFGGLYADTEIQNKVKSMGQKLAATYQISKLPYQFDFHVLADSLTVNAYTFPGGQIFITRGLLGRVRNDSELAALLSHEIGHVTGRHAAEELSPFEFPKLTDDTTASKEYDSEMMETYVSDLIDLKFDDSQEDEADDLATNYMRAGGYDPAALSEILKRLQAAAQSRQVGYLRKHPVTDKRMETMREQLQESL